LAGAGKLNNTSQVVARAVPEITVVPAGARRMDQEADRKRGTKQAASGGGTGTRQAARPASAPTSDGDSYFGELFENSPYDLFILEVRSDDHFVFERINPTLTRSTGYTSEMLVGKRPDQVLTPGNAKTLLARYRECVQGRRQVEYDITAITPLGELVRHTILVPIVGRDGTVRRILGTSTDVTALRRAEARLHEANDRLLEERGLSDLIVQNTADGVMVVDTELRYRVWNRAIEHINGRFARDVLGKTVFEETPGFADHPVGYAWRKAISGERAEMRDFRFFSTSRGAEVSYDADFAPLHGHDGAIIGAVCILRETTDRRRVEQVLLQAQKLEAVAQLTGGVAHDFNNLLTSVLGCLDLIAGEHHGGRTDRLVETAQRSAQRGAQLIQQLLAFARRQTLHAVPVDVNDLLKEIEVLLRRAVGEAVDVAVDGEPELWCCEVDRAQFEAALMNLAINARDAMPNGGLITLSTCNVGVGDIPPDVDLAPGEYVALAVEDNGEGMGPEIAERALDPFFTTKEVGKGTGLGLSMVYGFARQSGGGLRLESAPGEGTRVTLYFPRAGSLNAENKAAEASREPLTGAGTILVVEDDELVRELSVEMLTGLGYGVLVAQDGREALEVIERSEPIDLLFSDVVMPGGFSGTALARQARQMRPGLAVLLTTGYAGAQTVADDEFAVIAKPFRFAELSRALVEAIGRNKG